MIDCMIIGLNEVPFAEFVRMGRAMGLDSGANKDINLSFVQLDGQPYRSMDVLNRFYGATVPGGHVPFSNLDLLWPVVLYLGTYLHRRGFSFEYVNLFRRDQERLRQKLESGTVLSVAVTTSHYISVDPLLEVVEFVRRHDPRASIIVGGPWVQNQTAMLSGSSLLDQFDLVGADVYIDSREGEQTLCEVLRVLKHGGDPSGVPNVTYRRDGRWVRNPGREEFNPLEDNLVDYGLFPRQEFGKFVSLRTAKSCPFSCAFCSFPQRAGRYTWLGVDLVERELNAIADLGTVTTLTFLDDTFNVPKQRFKDILRLMIRNRYGFRWNSYFRCDQADEECIELMRESGCEGVFLGIESGSAEILRNMNKTARPERYRRMIPLLRLAGIMTHVNLVLGFPGETFATAEQTLELVEETAPTTYRAQLWYADSTTPIWERREEFQIQGHSFVWSHRTMDSATAADLVDRFFLCVKNSVWLPQWGFETWSQHYLNRAGMTRRQVENFIRCFNAAVKHRMVRPSRAELAGPLLDSLRASCEFRSGMAPDMRRVDRLSGERYRAAERYWATLFSGAIAAEPLRDPTFEDALQAVVETRVDGNAVVTGAEVLCGDWIDLSIAVFAGLMARWSEREEVTVLFQSIVDDEPTAYPIRLRRAASSTLDELVLTVARQRRRAARHHLFALHVLSNARRLAPFGTSPPVFDFAVCIDPSSRVPVDELAVLASRDFPRSTEALSVCWSLARETALLRGPLSVHTSIASAQTASVLGAALETTLSDAPRLRDRAVTAWPLGADDASAAETPADFDFSGSGSGEGMES